MTMLLAENAGKLSLVLAMPTHMRGAVGLATFGAARSTGASRARMGITSETIGANGVLVRHSSMDIPSGVSAVGCIDERIQALQWDGKIIGIAEHSSFWEETRHETEEFRVAELGGI